MLKTSLQGYLRKDEFRHLGQLNQTTLLDSLCSTELSLLFHENLFIFFFLYLTLSFLVLHIACSFWQAELYKLPQGFASNCLFSMQVGLFCYPFRKSIILS